MLVLPLAGPRLVLAQSATRCMVVEVFTRPESDQSARALAFLHNLEQRRRGVHVKVHDVAADVEARKRLYDLANRSNQKTALPAVYSGGQLIIGFRDAETTGRQIEGTLTVEAFVREGCPRCAEAKPYLYGVQARYPGLAVQVREITSDPYARARMEQLAAYYGLQPGIPTIHLGGRLIVGWNGLTITGSEIETLLHNTSEPCDGNHAQRVAPAAAGRAPPAPRNPSLCRQPPPRPCGTPGRSGGSAMDWVPCCSPARRYRPSRPLPNEANGPDIRS